MLERKTTREMASILGIGLKTAGNYRNRVNRAVGFDRPWEKDCDELTGTADDFHPINKAIDVARKAQQNQAHG